MKSGVLIINKAAGMTSHDVVSVVRRLFSTKKVGHTGTLDPNATGVLPVLAGNAVKASDLMPDTRKVYRAKVTFGASFDTEDVWGKKTAENERRPDRAAWDAACRAMEGDSMQIPPMVSAVKIGGRKLYEYARAGETVERQGRPIRVDRIEVLSFTPEEAELRVTCSRGTYIRTLISDLCKTCGVLGAMSALCREESGGFSLKDAVTLAELEGLTLPEREALLIPAEQLFAALPAVYLPPFFDKLIANGLTVAQYKLKSDLPGGQRARLYREGVFFALGEGVDSPEGPALKKIKVFPPDPVN